MGSYKDSYKSPLNKISIAISNRNTAKVMPK
ncbi:MAG: hypothetical protein ACI8VI_001049 [Granulosicoccus sp.]